MTRSHNRNARGNGSVRQRENGTWEARCIINGKLTKKQYDIVVSELDKGNYDCMVDEEFSEKIKNII